MKPPPQQVETRVSRSVSFCEDVAVQPSVSNSSALSAGGDGAQVVLREEGGGAQTGIAITTRRGVDDGALLLGESGDRVTRYFGRTPSWPSYAKCVNKLLAWGLACQLRFSGVGQL